MRSRNPLFLGIAVFVGPIATVLVLRPSLAQMMTIAKCDVPFVGRASGGTLIISETFNRNCRRVVLQTAGGESAESVVERLAQTIRQQNPFMWVGGTAGVSASGGTLTGLVGSCSDYMTAGTEVGLGIPPPPTSLTCNYDATAKMLRLRWSNPSSSAYDSLRLIGIGGAVPGAKETYVLDLSNRADGTVDDLDIWVIGVSHDIPSNAAALHVRGQVQEELFGIPFARGVAPNWTAWSVGKTGGVRCEEGQRDELVHKSGAARYNPVAAPDQKPFYQIMRTTGEHGGIGGIWREYLGLTPGHVYRLTVRVNTLDLGPDSGRWSYSLHAVAYHSSSPAITPEQMAGLVPLPDGSRGDPAGLIAGYDARRTTVGRYEECTGELVLPDGQDSITVWLRLSADRPDIKVAMDYARLEDLGRP